MTSISEMTVNQVENLIKNKKDVWFVHHCFVEGGKDSYSIFKSCITYWTMNPYGAWFRGYDESECVPLNKSKSCPATQIFTRKEDAENFTRNNYM